ncbi:MAG: toxin [Elusimicrobia bacterium]|nr:toxin [Elusimicrobiota bacterium]
MSIRWDPIKNEWLKHARGISFEEVVRATFVTTIEHPKRQHQKFLLFEIHDYIWAVPYVRNGDEIFLKTAFPSRVYTRKWIRGELG